MADSPIPERLSCSSWPLILKVVLGVAGPVNGELGITPTAAISRVVQDHGSDDRPK
jgi:hypothetical protein